METHSGLENTQEEGSAGRSKIDSRKIVERLDSRKTEGFNMIPTTLVKRAAHVLYIPSSKAITEAVVRRYSSK